MLTWILNGYHLVIDLPGNAWGMTKNFFENSLRKWWYSHY
jgi:hypothetical protein